MTGVLTVKLVNEDISLFAEVVVNFKPSFYIKPFYKTTWSCDAGITVVFHISGSNSSITLLNV